MPSARSHRPHRPWRRRLASIFFYNRIGPLHWRSASGCVRQLTRTRPSSTKTDRQPIVGVFAASSSPSRTEFHLVFLAFSATLFRTQDRQILHSGHFWRNPLTADLAARVSDQAPNDTGLPAAHVSPVASNVEAWCKEGSWSMCLTCSSLHPRPLKEPDASRLPRPCTRSCRNCEGASRHWIPCVADVPLPLRGLSDCVVQALRPLDVDCGPYQRNDYGYRIHTALIRFRWSLTSVDQKISALPTRQLRKQARKARQFLLQHTVSEYATFAQKHDDFLQRAATDPDLDPKLPLHFLEEPGLECAVWPDLYFHADLCETVERATDVRRLERAGPQPDPILDEGSELEEAEEPARHSVRRSFLRKVLGPILDYSMDYELLQFVFDLSMWSDIGSKRHALQHMPLRLALKQQPWTPAYWAQRHAALLDLQRQCGPPVLFKTWAPYEWSAPYHRWILDALQKGHRSRQHLAGPETLHLTHIMTEMFREWVHGGAVKHGPSSKRWSTSTLRTSPATSTSILNFAARVEFQDGKRKLPSQAYHGRETPHLHGLTFADSLQGLPLDTRLRADAPAEGHPLRGYVLDGQTGRTGSGWPVHAGPTTMTPDGHFQLHHTELDSDMGIRAYDSEELDVMKFHQDNVVPNEHLSGRGLLLRYVATYLSKFSNSFLAEYLDDTSSSGYSIAFRILATYHPGEPEMWLALAAQRFPQFHVGGTVKPIRAPWPGMDVVPDFVLRYQSCTWRGDDMSLLEWLRKTNDRGAILHWLRRHHLASKNDLSLEMFARQYKTTGEKIIAAETVRVSNDKFFGQWLAMNVPFRDLHSFLQPHLVAKVPDRYLHHACALQHAPRLWTSDDSIRDLLQLEAYGDSYIQNACSMLQAQRALIKQYLDGSLDKSTELDAAAPASGHAAPDVILDLAQMALQEAVNARIDRALAARHAPASEVDRLAREAADANSVLVCTGPPGSGKTLVADLCIQRSVASHATVLYALPTGQLAARVRQRHPGIHVDTCHGAFLLHRPRQEAVGLLVPYDFVLVDEALQLSAEHFDRLLEMWNAADRRPCLLLLGDPWQLPNIDGDSPDQHPKRRLCQHLHLNTVHRCKDSVLAGKLKTLRVGQLSGHAGASFVTHQLCRGHKAWSGHHEPTSEDIAATLRSTNNCTTFLTCTKRGAGLTNQHAVQVLFKNRNKRALGQVPGDYEDNPDNYHDGGKLREDRPPEPSHVVLYAGLRVVLTKNLDKEHHFVNGMPAVVEHVDSAAKSVVVRTDTGFRLPIYPFTDDDVPVGRVVYYPLRLGYAGTVYKYQGAELPHVTVWLDRPRCPAAGYVALSRVHYDRDYLIGGVVTCEDFTPARPAG